MRQNSLEDAAHDHHLAQSRFDGQPGEDPTQRSELVVGVQSVQLCVPHQQQEVMTDKAGQKEKQKKNQQKMTARW